MSLYSIDYEFISMFDIYSRCLSKYSKWIKEQIDKNKYGYIRVRREDLGLALKKERAKIMGNKYRDLSYEAIYRIIRVILFNDGITTELAYYGDNHYGNRQRVFILKKKKDKDILIPSLRDLEKKLKIMSASNEIKRNMGID